MKIRVLLNKVKVGVLDDFAKARDYFARHGVNLEWEFEESDIKGYKVEQQNFGSVGYRYQIVGHEKKILLSKDYITIFAFNGNEFPLQQMPTSKSEVVNECVLITLNTYKEGDAIGETYTALIHELMHGLNQLFKNKFKINVEDPMDVMFINGVFHAYYKNDQPEAQDSNFGEAWRRMLPYLPLLGSTSLTEPHITITRTKYSDKQVTGQLEAFNGSKTFKCFSLELPWKNNASNISCIPTGTYKVKYTFSPRFLKYTYEILGVKGRSGIRIHSANFVSQLNGCIALGDKLLDINADGQLDTINSRKTISDFENFMDRKEYILTIK